MDLSRSIEALKQLIADPPLGPTTAYYAVIPKDFEGNIAFRRLIWKLSVAPLIQEELRIICSRDMLFYVAVFGWTFSPKDESACPVQPFIPWPAQEAAMLKLQASYGKKPIVGPKSRGVGFSWMCEYVIEWFWHFRDWQSALLCSRKADMVDKTDNMDALFPKIDFMHQHQPEWLLPDGRELLKDDPNRASQHLKNSQTLSVMDGESTTSNIGRGGRRTVVLLDEFPAIPDSRAMANTVSETTNAPWFVGTPTDPFGVGKPFQEMISNPHIEKVWLHWTQDPRRNQGLYMLRKEKTVSGVDEIVRKELDPLTYNFLDDWPFPVQGECDKPRSPWYDAKCREVNDPAAIAREYDINGEAASERLAEGDLISHIQKTTCRPPLFRGEVLPSEVSLREGLEHLKPIWTPGGGHWELWCDLPDNRPPKDSYTIGIDISGGTGGAHSSQSVMSVWSNTTGVQVGEWRSFSLSPDELGVRASVCAQWFWSAFVVPEINGPSGTRFLNKLLECQCWNIYRRIRSDEEAAPTPTSKLGYFSSKGPEGVLRGLLSALTTGDAKMRSEIAALELLQYQYKGGKVQHVGSARNASESDKGAAHGDAAVAAGMAWHGVETLKQLSADGVVKVAVESEITEGTFAWRQRERKRAKEREAEESFAW